MVDFTAGRASFLARFGGLLGGESGKTGKSVVDFEAGKKAFEKRFA